MKIILDAMGGDLAPEAPVLGALEAAKQWGTEITLVGRGEEILEVLKEKHGSLLRNVSMVKFGNALVASGVERVHTKLGNRYKLVRVDAGE